MRVKRKIFETEHDLFRESVRQFVDTEIVPHHMKWSEAGKVEREMFTKAGRAGLLGMRVPTEYGGGGVDDFRFNAVIDEVVTASGASAHFLDNPLQRIQRDINTVIAHTVFDLDVSAETYGSLLLD